MVLIIIDNRPIRYNTAKQVHKCLRSSSQLTTLSVVCDAHNDRYHTMPTTYSLPVLILQVLRVQRTSGYTKCVYINVLLAYAFTLLAENIRNA
jgi:hypothetical protein